MGSATIIRGTGTSAGAGQRGFVFRAHHVPRREFARRAHFGGGGDLAAFTGEPPDHRQHGDQIVVPFTRPLCLDVGGRDVPVVVESEYVHIVIARVGVEIPGLACAFRAHVDTATVGRVGVEHVV